MKKRPHLEKYPGTGLADCFRHIRDVVLVARVACQAEAEIGIHGDDAISAIGGLLEELHGDIEAFIEKAERERA